MNPDFKLIIASDQEREKVFCEIYYKDNILGEISQETDRPMVTIYSHPEKWWEFSLEDFQKVLQEAKIHLIGKQ
ncbi:MAG: hypothetical protein WAM28_02970 [Chlamydiales bacterium]